MKHKEFITAYANKLNLDYKTVEAHIGILTNILADEFQKGESVTIRDFGRFYCKNSNHSHTKIFKFTPARRIKDILGWG